jgi:hypothetical protein
MTYQCAFRISLLISAIFYAHSAYAQREWTQVTFPAGAGNLQFPTVDTGYAVLNGDSLIRTTDGAQAWNGVALPFVNPGIYGSPLTFFGSYGWLLIHEDTNEQPVRLLHTTDYGFSWNVLPFDSSWDPTHIYFKSPSLGYLWGENVFYISTDSGKSWHARTVPPSEGEGSTIIAVGQPNVVVGVPNSQTFFVPYFSFDTGATWNRYSGPFMSSLGGSPAPPVYIGASTWITHNAWSVDNGQTWDTVPTTGQYVIGPMVTDTLGHGMFIGLDATLQDSVLYFTSDFGHSWDSAKVPFGEIEEGVITGNAWYVVPPAIDSDLAPPTPLFRSTTSPESVTQTAQAVQLQILTNPATHILELSLEDVPDEIRIVDFLGRTVGQYATQGGAFSVDVSSLPEGLYWVVTRDGAQPFVHLAE